MASNHLLRQASERGDIAKITARLAAGDDLEGRHKGTGRTPLLEATIAGHVDAVQLLLDRGADLTASCTAIGCTALGWATEQGHSEIARILVAYGAEPHDASAAPPPRAGTTTPLAQELMTISWPAVSWHPDDPAHFTDKLPDNATPAQVVRSYILATHAWETKAWLAHTSEPDGNTFDFDAALHVAHGIRDVHCTPRDRAYARASISETPDFTPDFALVELSELSSSRHELLVRHLHPEQFVHTYESLFVCMRKANRWRIDSVRERLIGTEKWCRKIL